MIHDKYHTPPLPVQAAAAAATGKKSCEPKRDISLAGVIRMELGLVCSHEQ